jgi:hypothetical protein
MARMPADSRTSYSHGIRGFVIGAVAGALIASLVAFVFAMFDVGAGGPGLHVIAGAAFGGFVGLMMGMVRLGWKGE